MMTHAKVDSFKLTITLDAETPNHIETLWRGLTRQILTLDAETGAIESNVTKHSIKLTADDGVTSIEVSKAMQRNGKTRSQAITLKISSKLLQARYYEGISIVTLPIVLSYLNKVLRVHALPELTLDDLLNSKITDADICRDEVLSQNERKTLCTRISRLVEPSSLAGHGYRYYYAELKRLTGCQVMSRETATLKKPFVKTYDKHHDSVSRKHSAFFSHYSIETPKGLQRLEVTLKDYKHFEKHNLGNTLRDLMQLCPKRLDAIITNTIKTYDAPIIANKKQGAYMTNLDLTLEYMLRQAQSLGKSAKHEIANLCSFIDSKADAENSRAVKKHIQSIKSRANAIVNDLTNEDKQYSKADAENSKVDYFLYRGDQTN